MPELSEAKTKWGRRQHVFPIIAVAVLGLVTAGVTWFAAMAWEERLATANFTNVAGDYAAVLQNGLDEDIRKIVAMRAFYDASKEVDPDEFDLFTSRLLGDHAAKMRITWSPFVPGADRQAFEAGVRSEGLPAYRIASWAPDGILAPAPDADQYFPIRYATDVDTIGPTLGIDLQTEPLRWEAVARARDGDRLATATEIPLRQADGRRGFFIALPVYLAGLPHDTIETRRKDLRGILAATFQTGPVLDAILAAAKLPADVDLYLYGRDAGTNAAPFYRHAGSDQSGPLQPKSRAEVEQGTYWQTTLKVGDTNWRLVATPAGGRLTGFYRAWIVLAAVILVFSAVLAYMWASLRYALRLETANSRVMALAETDLLTNLANRRAFVQRLTKAFNASRRGARPFAVLYLDIDEFKDVNDTLGHPAGDLLLKEVVGRLKEAMRDTDFVAQFGGDEFAILHTQLPDQAAPGALAARIAQLLTAPFTIDGHQVRITSSIGIALYAADVSTPEAMMVQADLALYQAKADGRNCFSYYRPELDQQVHERVRVADELRVALENGELELYYQPQVDLDTGRIIGLEALVRWNHKTRGLLLPASFIPIAERTGAALPLGHWVFEEACGQLKLWQAEGIAPPVVAVNVSGAQFKGASAFERDIERSLTRWNINPGDVELELTESVLMDATQRHGETLDYLRRLGTKIAIDDFGTGYSSLKYLTVYPVNRLKLAQEFVLRVTLDYRNAAVVRAAIRLAHELGIDVIAEGIESEAQLRFLVAAGCQQGQGFYISPPLNAARATELLREGTIQTISASLAKIRPSAA